MYGAEQSGTEQSRGTYLVGQQRERGGEGDGAGGDDDEAEEDGGRVLRAAEERETAGKEQGADPG